MSRLMGRRIDRHVEQGNRHMSWRLHGIQHHTTNSHIREGGSPGHPTLRTAVKGRIRSPDDREEGKSMTEEDEWTISCPFGSRVAGMMMIWGAMGRKSLTSERVGLQATPLEVGKSLKILSFERCPDMSQSSYSWCRSVVVLSSYTFRSLVEVSLLSSASGVSPGPTEDTGLLDDEEVEVREHDRRLSCRKSLMVANLHCLLAPLVADTSMLIDQIRSTRQARRVLSSISSQVILFHPSRLLGYVYRT